MFIYYIYFSTAAWLLKGGVRPPSRTTNKIQTHVLENSATNKSDKWLIYKENKWNNVCGEVRGKACFVHGRVRYWAEKWKIVAAFLLNNDAHAMNGLQRELVGMRRRIE